MLIFMLSFITVTIFKKAVHELSGQHSYLLFFVDVQWDNSTQYKKTELDKIQHEAARILNMFNFSLINLLLNLDRCLLKVVSTSIKTF